VASGMRTKEVLTAAMVKLLIGVVLQPWARGVGWRGLWLRTVLIVCRRAAAWLSARRNARCKPKCPPRVRTDALKATLGGMALSGGTGCPGGGRSGWARR